MYFEVKDSGRIMICAEEEIKPGMVMIDPPADFAPEEMHKWIVRGGELMRDPDYVEPPASPTMVERVGALETALYALEEGIANA